MASTPILRENICSKVLFRENWEGLKIDFNVRCPFGEWFGQFFYKDFKAIPP
jgi:hypothetical protein